MILRTFDFLYIALPQTHRCKRCNGEKKNPKAFSADNDTYPVDVPSQLEGMTQVGQMLIVKVAPIMRVYRLKGGQYAHGGHVVNIPQDVTGFTTSLPGFSFFENKERIKKSLQLTHPIRHDRREHAERATKSLKKRNIFQPSGDIFKILQTSIGKQYTFMLEAYDTRLAFRSSY